MEDSVAVYRFRVHGRVQGVSFRAYTAEQARDLGVRGWVANSREGTVVGVAAGSPEQVEALRSALEKGPPAARVERVDWQPGEGAPSESDFVIRSDVAE